jgi:hypothetical protein
MDEEGEREWGGWGPDGGGDGALKGVEFTTKTGGGTRQRQQRRIQGRGEVINIGP